MRIEITKVFHNRTILTNKQTDIRTANSFSQTNLPTYYYKDYNINFGARLNRTPEDFYAQKFNIDNMPETVKKYLFEDFEERRHMPPAQLQREAFEYLKLADSVNDIKDMYPEEPLFANLKELDDVKPSQGILLLLKWDSQTSQTPIFKDKSIKDLTVYLLRKVYLEGKTIDEINKDFDNDATDEIKYELGVKDKQYFSHSNIYTLGIRYPKLPYYNSFLATRNDKEYIPAVRKTGQVVSDETKQKLSSAMTKWWAGLNEIERSEQIQKMIEGKEMSNSIFSKYQGQIMTIAAAQMGFSEKLSEIFAEKYSNEAFMLDFPLFSERQREIMLEFWNKDSDFRENYSKTLQDTISDFEIAYYSEDKTQLENLLNKAIELKAKVLNKAKEKQYRKQEMQKLATPQTRAAVPPPKTLPVDLNSSGSINKLFRKNEADIMKFYPTAFKAEYMDFLMKNTSLQTRKEIVALNYPEPHKLLDINEEEAQELREKLLEKAHELNELFDSKYPLVAKTNEFLINQLLYKLTNDPMVFKLNRGEAIEYIQKHNLEEDFLKHNANIDSEMKRLSVKTPAKTLDEFIRLDFNSALNSHIKGGLQFYPEYNLNLQNISLFNDYENNVNDISKEFLKNYNAAIKYYKNTQTPEFIKNIIMEGLIVDYICYRAKNDKKAPVNNKTVYDNPLDANYNIDITSIYSMKYALQQYLHKNETKYWIPQVENKFLDFAVNQNYIIKESLQMFIATKVKNYKQILSNLSSKDKQTAYGVADTLMQMIHNDFTEAEPQTANANNAAINYILYQITHKPETLANSPIETADFIQKYYLGHQMLKSSADIKNKYEEYLQPLPEDTINEFYSLTFYPALLAFAQQGLKNIPIKNKENFEQAQKMIKNALAGQGKDIIDNIKRYLTNKSAFIRLINEADTPSDAKSKILEKLVANFARMQKAGDKILRF